MFISWFIKFKIKYFFRGITPRLRQAFPQMSPIVMPIFRRYFTWVYSEPCQPSKMVLLAKIVKDFNPLTTCAKSSIFAIWKGSKCASASIAQQTRCLNWKGYQKVHTISGKIVLQAEASTGGVPWKKVFLKISQNSQENICARVSLLIKLMTWSLQFYLKRDSGTRVFLWILWNF